MFQIQENDSHFESKVNHLPANKISQKPTKKAAVSTKN
jgi:hypothetical protein